MGPLLNPAYILEWMKQLYSMLLISGTFSVDSFFLLSGLLVTWSSLRHLDKSNGKLNIFLSYFHRYIRLTPPLAALVLLSSSLIRQVGSGPLWKIFIGAADKPCQNYWWSTLLYVQNYVNPNNMCIGHSWYLAVDTQLFVLSPIIVYPLWRWNRKFVWVIPILIALSMGCVFGIFMINHYSAQAITHLMGGNSLVKTYYPTHTRMGAWLEGVLLGYLLYKLKGKSIKLPKILIAIGWSIAIGTILAIIFGPYHMHQPDYIATDLESAFYESFSRVCWAISLSWIIFACVHGYGGPVNWFLSLPQWQPLARLSYSIYLLHLPIQLLIVASSRTQLIFTENLAIHKFWGDFGLTLTASLIWTLAFESPVVMLEKIMFSKKTAAVTVSKEHLVTNKFSSTEGIGPTDGHNLQPPSNKV
ncbi:hypothetical protein HA402_013497 [Bradysia odoriphaga]|nr:hypothetical protein HA402_013497 [Bradysia odoriphaga]